MRTIKGSATGRLLPGHPVSYPLQTLAGWTTKITYGLTVQLLFANPRSVLPHPRELPLRRSEASYSEADLELACEWITIEEYAKREAIDQTLVSGRSKEGKLGPVRTDETGREYVIWPPKMSLTSEDKLPPLGRKRFRLRMDLPVELDPTDMSQLESTQGTFLQLAHSMGDPEQAAMRAGSMLMRSGYLLQWTVFEVFLRGTVIELFRRHPNKLAAGKRAKQTLTYEDLVLRSSQFTSIEALADHLADVELEAMGSGGRSVHGIINFLKDEFRFKKDPYQARYRFKGEARTASYTALMDVKHKRNSLVHESSLDATGAAIEEQRPTEEVSEDDYDEARLILRSIAFSIADSIATGKYLPA